MNVYEAIEKRHTVRDFDGREISIDILKKIIKAGLCAPTNDHLRRWEFIIVNDVKLREDLVQQIDAPTSRTGAARIIDGWGMTNPIQRAMYIDGIPKQHSMILDAGALVLPCFVPAGDLLKPKTLSSLNPFASIWCCIENILIAASSEGIFGVTRIPFENERRYLKEKLQLPAEYEVACYLALGYPRNDELPVKQIEINIDEKIHCNGWNR